MGKKIRRTITITLTETWRIVWGTQSEESNKAEIRPFNEQMDPDNLASIVFSTHISNYQELIMTTAESRAFIQRYTTAINGKAKPAALVNQYVADADEALKQHIADAETAFPHYELAVDDLIVEGEKAVLRFTLRGTHQGNFMGIPATGREVNVPGIIIYRLATDENHTTKIVEHWMQIDSMALMQQLGVQPG
jgi:predicted ester cyclase